MVFLLFLLYSEIKEGMKNFLSLILHLIFFYLIFSIIRRLTTMTLINQRLFLMVAKWLQWNNKRMIV